MLGFVGPDAARTGPDRWEETGWIWASEQRWLDALTDASAYDWPRTQKAWYFQAFARDAQASVFVEKSPPWLFCVDDLARHFRNPRFVFMVRDPYAVCEGICRGRGSRLRAWGKPPDETALAESAARHVVRCLVRQRSNLERHGQRGVFFSYETMCDDPQRAERQIRSLAPELDDLRLRQRFPVKGRYHERLTNMNARQLARLCSGRVAAFNRVFGRHRDVFDYFGYAIAAPERYPEIA